MTDAEVLKAVECCMDIDKIKGCKELGCPLAKHCKKDIYALEKASLDLIKRQKKEIEILIRKKETLRDEVADKDAEIERLHEQEKTVAKMYYLKGVRDLAKRIRDKFYLPPTVEKKFDNILKELGGDTENGEKKD